MSFYVQTVYGILGHPRLFFSKFPLNIGMRRAFFCLLVSALFSCAASLLNIRSERLFLMAGIYLFNAFGMVFIMTTLGYLVMVLCVGKKVAFASLFSIYALCSGVTLLVSWIPYFVVFTEPWKWYLIGTGLMKSFDMKFKEVAMIIGLSLSIWILFYWSLIPIIT